MAHFRGFRAEGLGVKVGGLGFWLLQGEPIDYRYHRTGFHAVSYEALNRCEPRSVPYRRRTGGARVLPQLSCKS